MKPQPIFESSSMKTKSFAAGATMLVLLSPACMMKDPDFYDAELKSDSISSGGYGATGNGEGGANNTAELCVGVPCPCQITEVASTEFQHSEDYAHAIKVCGGYVYVAEHHDPDEGRLLVLDAGTPGTIVSLHESLGLGVPYDLAIGQDQLLIASHTSRVTSSNFSYHTVYDPALFLVDISSPGSALPSGEHEQPEYAPEPGTLLAMDDGTFRALYNGLLFSVAVTDGVPTSTVTISSTVRTLSALATANGVLYLGGVASGVPTLWSVAGGVLSEDGGENAVAAPGSIQHLAAGGSVVLAATSQASRNLVIYDTTNSPLAPVEAATYTTSGTVVSMEVAGDLVYVLSSEGLEVLDVADPANPSLFGKLSDTSFESLSLDPEVPGLVYLGVNDGMRVYTGCRRSEP